MFCGTERARAVTLCPICGRTWLDEPYGEVEASPQDSIPQTRVLRTPGPSDAELTAATMQRPWSSPDDEEDVEMIDLRKLAVLDRDKTRWLEIGRYAALVMVCVGLVVLASFMFNEWGTQVDTMTPPVAAITATHQVAATTSTVTQPQVSVAATSATNPTTAPTTAPTTTTTTTAAPYVVPIGDAVPVDDLRLTVYGIGDLRFGDPSEEVAGVLAATFGRPDFGAPAEPGTDHPGVCPGSASSVLRWGILEITFSDGAFAGYRLDARLGDQDSATAELRTASGLQVGATVSTLETIYRSYHIVYDQTPDFGPEFSLQRSNGDELIWGPLTSTDPDGVVLGVYSPTACD
ncbi:MAG: hypothetical protein GWP04_12450 [Gammaproteobacteria bacterium]|nr:hypothetical protein [Gammaproteobacteria bacterium]